MNAEPFDLSAAQAVLAAHREAFEAFSRLLIEHNRTTNLTRIDSVDAVRSRHFIDSLAGLAVLDEAAGGQEGCFSLIDVGSGAGLPGLAIAIARPQWRVVSLEATAKKVRFQHIVCQALGLANVDVRQGRAELTAHDSALREGFDAVLARAVAGLDILAELTMGFVRSGGLGLFWKGPQVQEEIAAAEAAFEKMGGGVVSRLLSYQTPDGASPLYLAAVVKTSRTPADRPRQNFAAIRNRPLR